MATFTELLDDVYALTNRPDLVAETKLAVKSATLKMHQSDFYYKDLFETPIQFDTEDYIQALEYRTLIPRFRSVKYFRKADSAGTPGDFLTLRTPAEILDRYGYERADIFYVAGELIQIKSSTRLKYFFFGCYLNPDITEAGFNSWIALDHPYAIVFEAAVTVFKTIGYDEQATVYQKLAAEQLAMLKSSNILAEGF
jgi:hypothetical protein